jgi:inhibitor of KinA
MNCVLYGPKALLFRFAEKVGEEAFAKGCAIADELERNPPAGMIEFVPAFTTVLVKFEEAEQALATKEGLIRSFEKCESAVLPPRPIVDIPVTYNGIDLQRVAELHALTTREAIEIHSGNIYKVYMLGFSPGFPYLGDLDARLHTARLPSPRTRVPADGTSSGTRT